MAFGFHTNFLTIKKFSAQRSLIIFANGIWTRLSLETRNGCYVLTYGEETSRYNTHATIPRSGRHPMKIMLPIWWNMRGVDQYLSITSDIYCRQWDRLNNLLIRIRSSLVNRKGVHQHHDHTRPYVARLTKQKIG